MRERKLFPSSMLTHRDIEQIGNLLERKSTKAPPKERRSSKRLPHPVIELVAPHVDQRLPAKWMLREVHCCDLSEGGMSFFLPQPPDFEYAVVRLGTPSKPTYMLVSVVDYRLDEGVRIGYVVGCSFIREVKIPG
ncbi:MAG: PilZ domain-containing protein [Thermoguttaceae bacterium]|jgi:hypothetical protein